MKLKGIVFDLDGTLVDSLTVTFDAFNHGITLCGGRQHTPAEIMSYFGPGEGQIFAKIVGPEQAEKAYAACREYTDQNLHRIPLHPGIAELLETLKSTGMPISIFTGRSWNTTEIILKHHRLLDRFVTVIANDHVPRPKPAPDGLRLALSRMRLEPSGVVLVGDMPADIQAAHTAGAGSVAALWDLMAKREELEPHSPHYWAEKPAELLQILTIE
jgi:AHBA synthesis associated protein